MVVSGLIITLRCAGCNADLPCRTDAAPYLVQRFAKVCFSFLELVYSILTRMEDIWQADEVEVDVEVGQV